MKLSEQNEFKKALFRLAGVFVRELSDVTVDAYWEALQPFSLEQVVAAAKYCEHNCKFFPVPLEMIEAVRKIPPKTVPKERRLESGRLTPEEAVEARLIAHDEISKMRKLISTNAPRRKREDFVAPSNDPGADPMSDRARDLRLRELRRQAQDLEASDGEV